MTIKVVRLLVGALGVGAAAYGVRQLLLFPDYAFWDVARWLVGGVIAHDAILAPLAIGVSAVGLRILPPRARAPLAAGLLILGTVTLTAVPVLLSRGARPDNSTLLDRNYAFGWLALAALVAVGVALAMVLRRGDVRTGVGTSREEPGGGV